MLSIIAYRSGKIRSSLSCESGTEINEPPMHMLDSPINKVKVVRLILIIILYGFALVDRLPAMIILFMINCYVDSTPNPTNINKRSVYNNNWTFTSISEFYSVRKFIINLL